MLTPLRHRFLVALTLALPVLTGACNSELHGHAEVFLDALDSDDYAKFQSIAHTECHRGHPQSVEAEMRAYPTPSYQVRSGLPPPTSSTSTSIVPPTVTSTLPT